MIIATGLWCIGTSLGGLFGGRVHLILCLWALLGAFVGTWIAGVLGLPEIFAVNVGGRTFPIVWSVIGSALFVALLALLTRGPRRVV